MSEADKYTTEMWKSQLGRVARWVVSNDVKRSAFSKGFNGEPMDSVHHTSRDAWFDGRHSAVLLGYASEAPHTIPKGDG